MKKFKRKYLFILLIIPIVLLFSKVEASDNIYVSTEAELQNAVNKTYLQEKQSFKLVLYLVNGFGYDTQVVDYYCKVALDGFKKMGAFYHAGTFCKQSVSSVGSSRSVSLAVYGVPLTKAYYPKIMDYVETEGSKMYNQTKDKEELIKLVYKHIDSMMWNRHDFFYNEESPLHYDKTTGYNLLAALFYDYFNIENLLIKGKSTSGQTQFWNLVKLGTSWYHVFNLEIMEIYLVSDAGASKHLTWDNGAYPKASNNYAGTVKETTSIKPIITETDIPGPNPDIQDKPEYVDPAIGASSWAKDNVREAIQNGIVPSVLQNNYQTPITREQFCDLVIQVYVRLTGDNVFPTGTPFTDTNSGSITKAFDLGIVNGVGNNKFAPNNLVTREQIAVMFNNLLKAIDKDITVNSYIVFADSNEISSWAKDAVQALYKLNIMQGVGGNKINPKGNATIEQAIILSNKLYNQFK